MERKVILAIDDNLVQLDMFKKMLVPKYDLRLVKSASDAIHFLNVDQADVILLDIEMPNISGFDFLADNVQKDAGSKVRSSAGKVGVRCHPLFERGSGGCHSFGYRNAQHKRF